MGFLFGRSKTGQQQNTSANKLSGMSVHTSSQGVPIQLVYGKARVVGNLLWYGDFTAVPHTTTETTSGGGGGKGGGGGGGESQTVTRTTYTYTAGVAIGIGEGPVDSYGSVWASKNKSDVTALGMTTFTGSYSQNAWSYLTTYHPADAYTYRGTAYVANGAFDLGSGSSLPNLSFEVGGLLGPVDTNPISIAFDLATNAKYGASFPQANFDAVQDSTAYCLAADIVVSPVYKDQRVSSELIEELALIANCGVVWSEGKLKLIPYADKDIIRLFPLPVPTISSVYCSSLRQAPDAWSAPTVALDSCVPSFSVLASSP